MEYNEAQEKLSMYLDGDLEDQERATVDNHLSSCESCRRQLAAMETLCERLRESLQETIEPVDMTESVMSLLPVRRKRVSRRPAWALAAAACLLASAAVGLYFVQMKPGPTPKQMAVEQPQKIRSTTTPKDTPALAHVDKPVAAIDSVGAKPALPKKRPAHARYETVPRMQSKPIGPSPESENLATNTREPEIDSGPAPAGVTQEPPVERILIGDMIVENSIEGKFLCTNIVMPRNGGEVYTVRLLELPSEPPWEMERRYLARAAFPDDRYGPVPFSEMREVVE